MNSKEHRQWQTCREAIQFVNKILTEQNFRLRFSFYYLPKTIPSKICYFFQACKRAKSSKSCNLGRDPFNQNSNRSDREKWSTSKGGPVFSKLFRLDRTDPFRFGPKFPEILVEWIAPLIHDLFRERAVFYDLAR